ncbi:transporter substrate-binding domain-containing protein [Helicobacter sp. MIT 14-3879]|uniref:transporter substrate-binding domain-containing protein n=1 Tax=Helicobacter sp. MIT 14-3879 TaxID=2040649 RepID=UPI000E1F678E|nr:transporter substrate-binding domain-containing protein [Helicobacter sp. MIT 14-3879]RDU65551.1 arginine-binding protein [Helicobacter sp. MIT 14-3879]
MKYKILGIIMAVFSLFIGCKNDNLSVATAANFAPFEYIDGGEFKGIDIEIAKIIADELKLNLVINDMEFDSVVQSVVSKNSNIAMSGLAINDTRKQVIDFSDTYFNAAQMILVRENDKRFFDVNKLDSTNLVKKINSIKNLKIGVQAGTTGEFYAKGDKDWGFDGFKKAEILSFTNGAMAVTAMLNNQVDIVIIDEMPAKVLQKSNKGTKIIDIALTNESYAIGVSKDNKELLENINKILSSIKEDGRLEKIISKYYE